MHMHTRHTRGGFLCCIYKRISCNHYYRFSLPLVRWPVIDLFVITQSPLIILSPLPANSATPHPLQASGQVVDFPAVLSTIFLHTKYVLDMCLYVFARSQYGRGAFWCKYLVQQCMIECFVVEVIHWYSHACMFLDQSAVPVQEEKLASDRSLPV